MISNIVVYIFILICTLVLAFIFQEYYTLAAFIFLMILPLIVVVINFIATRYIELEVKNKAVREVIGNKTSVYVKIMNDSIFPVGRIKLSIVIRDNLGGVEEKSLYTNVGIKEDKTIEINFDCETSIGGTVIVKKARCYDYFGLTSWNVKPNRGYEKVNYSIYPAAKKCNVKFSRNTGLNMEENERFSTLKPGPDRSEVFGIREYAEGDNVRDIHWKLSSKKENMIVKEFSLPLENKVTIIVDSAIHPESENKYKLFSKYVEYVTSLCETFVNNYIPFRIIVYSPKYKGFVEYTLENDEQIYILTEMLLRQNYEITKDNPYGYKPKNIEEEALGGNIIYVSSGVDYGFMSYLEGLDAIKKIYVINVGKGEAFEEKVKMFVMSGSYKYISLAVDGDIMDMESIDL